MSAKGHLLPSCSLVQHVWFSVQRAKRLLDKTDLPMTEIALRSGFRSLRRFNAVFAEIYRRPPMEMRRASNRLVRPNATLRPELVDGVRR